MHTTGFYRLEQILTILPISKSAWFLGIEIGYFPHPCKFGRASMWPKDAIINIVETIKDGSFFILKKMKEKEYEEKQILQ